MKKVGVLLLAILLLSVVPHAFAATNSTDSDSSESETDKINDAYDCLEDKVGSCSGMDVQEIALTILATPSDDVFDDCVDELMDEESNDHWGNIRDTALAILALDHAGKDTSDYEDWLLDETETPTELIWYLQEDSEGETECNIQYDSKDYTVIIGENKKIQSDAGSCLDRAQSNFWFEISSDCYDEEFMISCDKDFITALLYKNEDSEVVYPLEGSQSASGLSGTNTITVNSSCFGSSSTCDYEATAWATFALLETGHDIEEFIPYLIATADTNEGFLPNSFIYMVTDFDDYASNLISDQSTGFYWLAEDSEYDKVYDTALALLSLSSSSSDQVSKARDWLLFSQAENGCWQNSITDTAIALWALEGRSGRSSDGGSVTYCTSAGFYCIPSTECPSAQLLDNYFCSGSNVCCENENLVTCSEYGGQICESGLVCSGNEREATDTDYCCIGSCVEAGLSTECESMYYSCRDTCSDSQEEVNYDCDGQQVCCKTKIDAGGSSWWIWLLIILLLVGAGVLGWFYRENLKLWWFKLQSKFKKDKGSGSAPSTRGGPSYPSRPGFPPIRRTTQITPPQRRSYDRRDDEMSDTFKKLRDLSK